jgi:DNA-binding beta-propeller fold protein YncE
LTIILFTVLALLPAAAQVVVGTVNVGIFPATAGANSAINQVYVANECGSDPSCQSPGSVSVIDGTTLSVQTVTTGDYSPYSVAVNPSTNKIYTGTCGSVDSSCYSTGTALVIDGATLATHDVPVGIYPGQVAVNSVTNKIYVANQCGTDPNCVSLGTVTVIDGATLSTQQVNVGAYPFGVTVNSATNTIYVTNTCGNDLSCNSPGTVTVIDGNTLATQTVNVGFVPVYAGVNSVTNTIYVPNSGGADGSGNGTVTVIDGATLSIQTVNVGVYPTPVTVNAVTNTIYVGNDCGSDPSCMQPPSVSVIDGNTLSATTVSICSQGTSPADDIEVDPVRNQVYLSCMGNPYAQGTTGLSVTVLDGATNGTVSVSVGDNPMAAVVDPLSNRIYVPNSDDDDVSVIAGPNAAPLQFVSVTPCRLLDTRNGNPIQGGTSQSLILWQLGGCNIPSSAAAYSLNVTVVPRGPLGYLTIWPTGEDQPVVSTMNSVDGRIKANAAIVPGGYQGAVSVYVTQTTDVILDIDGYFAQPGSGTYQFYPLTPCRVVDTRDSTKPQGLGPPALGNMETRDLPVLTSPCLQNPPQQPQAYSLNVTVVPNPSGQPLNYLTVWPSDQNQPVVSTLNNPTGTVVANGAIVPAAANNGNIKVFAYDSTDVIMDINGYFAPPGQNGLSFYPGAPCRAYDSRNNNGQPFQNERTVNIVDGACGPPSSALAYVLNATVVPNSFLNYLTLWPDSENQPVVSTLNAYDGFIASNMAIVPNVNGSLDAYASQLTQLILDISGYFAPLPPLGTRLQERGSGLRARPTKGVERSTRPSGRMLPHAPQCKQSLHQPSFAHFGCAGGADR